jgi:ABC-type sugar transport system ATPase subunit
VNKGEIVGLAGLVGAGRTEVARAVFGVQRPTQGTIAIEGREVKVRSPIEARRLGMALVPEDRIHDGLLMPQSVAFNATLASLDKLSIHGWIKEGQVDAMSRDHADRLNLAYRSTSQPVAELSGGNQQKVVLSKWLMTSPKLLVLDEPTRGVDIGAKGEVHRIVRSLADQGIAVLLVSSDLPELLVLCDRIAVMRGGRIVGWLDKSDATEEKVMTLATGGQVG